MALISEDKLEEVRTRADIVEVIGAHVRLKRAGRNFVGLCPFHNEKTPSFSVNSERGFFHCFGCGAGGTVFNFVMRTEGLSFPEAIESLARRYGVTLPERGGQAGPGAGERDAALRANQTAADFFVHVLWKTPDGAAARDYLAARGVAAETARTFGLGFAPERPANLARALERRGLLAAAARLGLVRQDAGGTRDMFRGRLMFPIRDGQGRVLAFGGRVLDQRLPKYINSPESPLYSKSRNVYGLYEARAAIASADRAIVVEGYLDAIAVWQAGFKETVASLGTALTADQLRLVGRHTRNVLACFDGDAAGRKASLRALEIFLAAGLLGRGIFIPPGFDPDTFIKERGAQAFTGLIASADLLVDYFLAEQAAAARGSLEARVRAAAAVAEVLKAVHNPFEFDLLARKAADALGVGEEVLRAEARRPARGGGASAAAARGAAAARAPSGAGDGATAAEVGLLAVALLHPELRSEIAAHAAMLEDASVAGALAEVCASQEPATVLEVEVAERLGEAQRSRLSALAVGPLLETAAQARALARDFAGALTRRRQQRAMETTRRAAASAGSAGNDDEAMAAAQAMIALRRRGG
ncbi:MAG TPA: DNA primase [Candidatus Binataceae bacterium]|nr:DNA primase [Candidatus Binataceae bacterium]